MNPSKSSSNNPIFQPAHVERAATGQSIPSVEPGAEVEAVEEEQAEPATESAAKE